MKYNRKIFIAPNSLNSMSAIHCKIVEGDIAVARISDCHRSVKFHNKISDPAEKFEFLEKLENLIYELQNFKNHIENENI